MSSSLTPLPEAAASPEPEPESGIPNKPAAKLRVAIFSDSLPERNGAGSYYSDLAEQLGVEIERLEIFQPTQRPRLLQLAFPLPGDPTQKLITPNVPRLWKQFVRFRPNVVVTVTPGPFGLLGLFLARRFQSGFLTAFHTHFEELVRLYYDPMSQRVARNYLVTVNRVLCKRSDAVLVNNPELTKAVQALGARKVEVIGTPFPISFLSEPLSPPPETFHQVLFAGRLAPEKNLGMVIEAARKVPELKFVLAGEGPLREKLQQQARGLPNVIFTGWITRAALRQKIDESNLLLLPSHNETFGTVALEAMARGRPALVAQAAGIHQWENLRPGLFTLKTGQCASDILRELQQKPREFWQEKAVASRDAAASLNTETIQHWLEFLSRHARPWTRKTPQNER